MILGLYLVRIVPIYGMLWLIAMNCFGAAQSALWMDVEWVLQSRSFSFDGFFIEVLGIAESLHAHLPFLRLTKSSYMNSFDESPIASTSTLLSDIFPKERTVLENIVSKVVNLDYLSQMRSPKSLFMRDGGVDQTTCTEHHPNNPDNPANSVHQSVLGSPNLAKYKLTNILSFESCCDHCKSLVHCNHFIYNPTDNNCLLKSNHEPININVTTTFRPEHKIGSVKSRSTVPRVIIFHGTTCVYHNTTLPMQRDINTIYIGRYMIERAVFSKGLTMGDYSTLYCAGLMDELWVPTAWQKEVMSLMLSRSGSGQRPEIVIVPEAVDTALLDRQLEKEIVKLSDKQCSIVDEYLQCVREENKRLPFVFLSIFKWEERKGWDILLRAYWNAFTHKDDVILLIHSYLPSPQQSNTDINRIIHDYAVKMFDTTPDHLAAVHWINNMKSTYHPRLVEHLGWQALVSNVGQFRQSLSVAKAGLTRQQVRQLYALSDSFVLPTRGEGWGLPISEAMAMELPVIVTNYSGPAAFVNDDNAYPIPVEMDLDELSYAIPKEEELARLMRAVVMDSITMTSECVLNDSEVCDVGEIGEKFITVAQMKGIMARRRMQEINSEYIVSIMKDRLIQQALRRGWNFTYSSSPVS